MMKWRDGPGIETGLVDGLRVTRHGVRLPAVRLGGRDWFRDGLPCYLGLWTEQIMLASLLQRGGVDGRNRSDKYS